MANCKYEKLLSILYCRQSSQLYFLCSTWPREAAAKAGRINRDNTEDEQFRRSLRGLDADGNLIKTIIGTFIDAMDPAGRWYQAEIAGIDRVKDSESSGSESDEKEDDDSERARPGEIRAVKIDFRDVGGYEEWILVESDRLAVKGRFTQDSMKSLDSSDTSTNGKQSNGETKSLSLVLRRHSTKEPSAFQLSSSVCSFPGFGACGLANLGNTCYANSALQCITYMPLLRSYLIGDQFKLRGDVNKNNPLGTGGKLLEEFATLQRHMWSGKDGVRYPTKFRASLGKSLQQYAAADQQDAQELLNDLIDALHEDSNKVVKKPYVEGLEDRWVDQTVLTRVGEESWRRFLRRNRSIITNIGMGQVLNRVTCPVCQHTSRNFDPFNMLSIPFPTVSNVVFKCELLRRATAYNCPQTLGLKNGRRSKVHTKHKSPPSEQSLMEEYVITMSRLADMSELKQKLHELCGIPLHRLKLFITNEKKMGEEENASNEGNVMLNLSAVPEREGPCLQFARQSNTSGEFVSPDEVPTTIIVFESTLNRRPIVIDDEPAKVPTSVLDSSPKDEDRIAESFEEDLKTNGSPDECRLFDTDPTRIAIAMSRALWPELASDLKLGLRVDAKDQRSHWFSGTVVGISPDPLDDTDLKVKVHFDNFSSKWDLMYTFKDFTLRNIQPLHSHTHPKPKATEFQILHSQSDKPTLSFSHPFMIQCDPEWSIARAGAHILAQASRFIENPLQSSGIGSQDFEFTQKYRETLAAISRTIDIIVEANQKYVNAALFTEAQSEDVDTEAGVDFDGSFMVERLERKLCSLLPKLPFDVRIRDTTQSSDEDHEDDTEFEFRLDRTIGNYINARHCVLLEWKIISTSEPLTLFCNPVAALHPSASKEMKDEGRSEKERTKYAHGGMHLDLCLNEFCKKQSLEESDCWRCPKCKDVRLGQQSMKLWRLPDLLTFHLKRFNCSARWREKITTKINFPLTGLNMKEWCDNDAPSSSEESYVYDLVGVVNHYGGMTGGHYVAACKVTACSPDGSEEVEHNFNGAGVHAFGTKEKVDQTSTWRLGRSKDKDASNKYTRAALSASKSAAESSEPLWLQFDDDSVEPIPPRKINSESAYVLFYRRRRISPSNIAKYSMMD